MILNLELREGEPDSCGHYLAEVLQRNHYALAPGEDDKWSWRVLWYRPDWPEGERWERIDETMTVRRWSKLPSEADMLGEWHGKEAA